MLRPQTGLNAASNGFIKASKMCAAPMKVTFRGLSHTTSSGRNMAVNDSDVLFQKEVRGGVPEEVQGVQGGPEGSRGGLEEV